MTLRYSRWRRYFLLKTFTYRARYAPRARSPPPPSVLQLENRSFLGKIASSEFQLVPSGGPKNRDKITMTHTVTTHLLLKERERGVFILRLPELYIGKSAWNRRNALKCKSILKSLSMFLDANYGLFLSLFWKSSAFLFRLELIVEQKVAWLSIYLYISFLKELK